MMTHINNNAESLSRELRKFKNLKTIDFKGLLSGTAESYVNLYRYLLCESNVGFSQLILDKGYDLTGLTDYKFMEAVYRIMRDLLDTKPPINQNQFFSPGFTQRKLEMSTIIAAQVRKITNELINKNGKKSVQTPSLMKSSLKRSNSAPRQPRVIEMGDEPEGNKHKTSVPKYRKTKSSNRQTDNSVLTRAKKDSQHDDNSGSSDDVSDESDVACSYHSQSRMNPNKTGNNYDVRAKTLVERLDQLPNYSHQSRPNELIAASTYEGRPKPFLDSKPYSSTFTNQKSAEAADISAFEYIPSDTEKYRPRTNTQERLYDVKQYAPSTFNEPFTMKKSQSVFEWEKVMQQFDTVLARITLLEGRMQRIESKLESGDSASGDRAKTVPVNPSQGNFSNSEYMSSYDLNSDARVNSYSSKGSSLMRGIKEAIPDFESTHAVVRPRLDSDRSYTSSNYSTNNYKAQPSTDYNYSGPRCVTNYTNHSERPAPETHDANGHHRNNHYPLSWTYTAPRGDAPPNTVGASDQYQPLGKTHTPSLAPSKPSNGIPPLYPATKKLDTAANRDHRSSKQSDEKALSQTDRIASMLSDTQKMLRLSDEEL